MRSLAAFVMSGRSRAILVAAASAILALAVPPLTSPFSYVGGAIIALATLRLGLQEGFLVLGGAALGTAVLGYLTIGRAQPVLVATLMLWVPAWLLAGVLRSSRSLALAMQMAAALGVVALLLVYALFGDPAPWWRDSLGPVLIPLLERAGVTAPAEEVLKHAADLMTGVLVAATVLGLMVTLLLARAWQAMLYNPGGFRSEFHGLRMQPLVGWLTLGCIVLAQLLGGLVAVVLTQSAMVLLVMYFLTGLALVHGVVGQLHAHVGWLAGVYVLLFLAPPQVMLLLTIMGLADSWFDFRGRIDRMRGKSS